LSPGSPDVQLPSGFNSGIDEDADPEIVEIFPGSCRGAVFPARGHLILDFTTGITALDGCRPQFSYLKGGGRMAERHADRQVAWQVK
jgi:hypothetical protein